MTQFKTSEEIVKELSCQFRKFNAILQKKKKDLFQESLKPTKISKEYEDFKQKEWLSKEDYEKRVEEFWQEYRLTYNKTEMKLVDVRNLINKILLG